MNSVDSLDQRYLDFAGRTAYTFEKYPQLEPLRLRIFKDLFTHGSAFGWKEEIKHWIRPLISKSRSQGPLEQADVLILLESQREVIVDTLMPVFAKLVSLGVSTRLVSRGGPDDLLATIRFQFPASARRPVWAPAAWSMLSNSIERLGTRALRRTFYHLCAEAQGMLDECERLLLAVKPKVVLTASTQLAGGAAMMVASRAQHIPALLLQHGVLQPFYTPIVADYMLTWGISSNDTIGRFGVPREKLITVGSPRHDSMTSSSKPVARRALQESLSLPDRPTMSFFSNGNDLVRNGRAPAECARWLENAAALYSKELNVIVRLHPNEDGALYRDCKHLHVSKGEVDLATTLIGSDWVGSLCSTVLYDALLYNKAVWQFHADDWPDLADNWKQGLAERVSSEEMLRKMMRGMLSPGRQSRVEPNLSLRVFSNQGRADDAIANFILAQLGRPRTSASAIIGRGAAD